MSSQPMLLKGEVDTSHQEIDSLREEVNGLRSEVAYLRAEMLTLRKATFKLWSPVYKALQPVFGDLDPVADLVENGSAQMPDRKRAVWESWKQKLPGKRAEFIHALLDHGAMTATQLRVATHTAAGSVAGIIHELKKLGLINKIGDEYSLKEL